MAVADLVDWLDDFDGENVVWYAKRLSANDTLANKSHQVGPYIPKELLFSVFPSLHRPDTMNPDIWLDLYVDSHSDHRKIRAIWYNNRLHGKTRNETRLTNFGGASSALLDPDSTGALVVFVFRLDRTGAEPECHVWVCRHETEEDLVEDLIGPVEPGRWAIWRPMQMDLPSLIATSSRRPAPCYLAPDEIPTNWLTHFPSGTEICEKTVDRRPDQGVDPDRRLIRRRECEFQIFCSIEDAIELPLVQRGFASIDQFVGHAQIVLQRRRSRLRSSLGLHVRQIFLEEGLREGTEFAYRPKSELRKRPDFLFPSEASYKNLSFPDSSLRMLAVKTTSQKRWRRLLKEADRIRKKHLLTVQEGVSEGQFREMSAAGVQLVVPAPLIQSYPKPVRPHLQTLESFIGDIRLLALGTTV